MDEVRKQVEKLYEEAEGPTEEYNAIREQQKKLRREADRARTAWPASSRRSTNCARR